MMSTLSPTLSRSQSPGATASPPHAIDTEQSAQNEVVPKLAIIISNEVADDANATAAVAAAAETSAVKKEERLPEFLYSGVERVCAAVCVYFCAYVYLYL
jgi:hypothetical protein